MAVQGGGPAVDQATTLCTEARDALIIAIAGFLCCVFLAPVAIIKANKAKQMIAANPRLGGGGLATAAIVIAIINIILFVLTLIARFSQLGQL